MLCLANFSLECWSIQSKLVLNTSLTFLAMSFTFRNWLTFQFSHICSYLIRYNYIHSHLNHYSKGVIFKKDLWLTNAWCVLKCQDMEHNNIQIRDFGSFKSSRLWFKPRSLPSFNHENTLDWLIIRYNSMLRAFGVQCQSTSSLLHLYSKLTRYK